MTVFFKDNMSFRHESGSLVASLVKRFGTGSLDMVEDAVQQSLAKALEAWPHAGVPDNPSAWLYTVSYRELISRLRTEARLISDESLGLPDNLEAPEKPEVRLKRELESSLLQMLFVACHPAVPFESQLVFTLKSLCGFSIEEAAERLFISTANAYKRFTRAKNILRDQSVEFEDLSSLALQQRLPGVRKVLYTLFSEGYFSSNENELIRQDLCQEALYLTTKLCAHKPYAKPETLALCALMFLHFSMLNSRKNNIKDLSCFRFQDRSEADLQYLNAGMEYLAASASGEQISRFHIEANIAAEYALASSYQDIPWHKIVASYELLSAVEPGNCLHILNHAVALTEWGKPQAGKALLEKLNTPTWLKTSYIWYAVQAYVHCQLKHLAAAQQMATEALERAPTDLVKQKLMTRLSSCFAGGASE